jgi:methionyl-tRNA formyltransferase
MKVIFMGTPDFSCPTLQALLDDNQFDVVAAYTKEPKISGRGHKLVDSPVHKLALLNNLQVFTPKTLKTKESQLEFKSLNADIAVVVAYGLILPLEILKETKFGCINIHPSLLPKWRGAAPIQRTIMSGDSETGVCTIKMDEGLDSGDIIMEEKFHIDQSITCAHLSKKLSILGANLLVKSLKNIATNNFELKKQDHSLSTYAHKIQKEECLINWQLPAIEIYNKIRGLNGSLTAHFEYNNQNIKIHEAEIIHNKNDNYQPGAVVDGHLTIACKDGLIRPIILQKPSKKKMSVDEFMRGFPIPKGSILK